MEDENGLELSLGLSCGGSSVKSKGKNGVPSDTRAEEVDRGNSFTDDFKNFLHPGTQKHDSSMGEDNLMQRIIGLLKLRKKKGLSQVISRKYCLMR